MRSAARLLCAAATLGYAHGPALAQAAQPQVPDAAELDPSAPLDPMPDLGVEWPDLNARDQSVPPPPDAPPGPPTETADADEGVSERRYVVAVEGLGPTGISEELLDAFHKQSVLEDNRGDPANAAQIDRRSRADAELLAELLRSQGYYDALVEPRTESAGNVVRVVLEAQPGQQDRFASVALPGLETAGAEADQLRETFGIKAGDPVIAQDVIAGELAL